MNRWWNGAPAIFMPALALVMCVSTPLFAAGPEEDGGYGDVAATSTVPAAMENFEKGMQAVKDKDFKKAVTFFQKANELEKDNPEFLNMLAYSQRKTGDIDVSIKNYKRALELKPDFTQAHEYLGEAYIQAAVREIGTLKRYGKNGEKELQQLIAALKEAAAAYKKGKG